ncbi:TPA: hypothetical protein PFE08_002271 [Kluyvera ascorbata]|nr:hypothetical protein [Kluyvera ascorbata]
MAAETWRVMGRGGKKLAQNNSKPVMVAIRLALTYQAFSSSQSAHHCIIHRQRGDHYRNQFTLF